ncbi:acyl-CoA thioester hydrolase [Actinomadura hallensis]|uniref:Acyl-CoA thioester hydrolase n=1 Tax=Actinomadura hallensis TaxID=337895 RepID=A0A543IF68_9ACTN|nr:thioesterase family protein [Actinomadura hallensis]TQM69221.1 acyl-CoA thioester hydrolase [Actinomadura hallensis]
MGEVFTHRLRVRYSECDQQGVVFNGHYLFFYDVALTEMWRELVGEYGQMVRDGYDLVVAEARIRFREGARFDDLVDVSMPLAHLGVTSMVVRPVFRVDGRLIADGEVRHVFIDPETKAKREMPPRVRAALEPFLAAPDAGGPGARDGGAGRAAGAASG